MDGSNTSNSNFDTGRIIDLIIKVGLIILLFTACFLIMKPFLFPVVWGVIIAIALYPPFNFLQKKLGGKAKLAAVIITLISLAILLVPVYLLSESLVDGIIFLKKSVAAEQLVIPPPSQNVAEWPLIGEWAYDTWYSASENLEAIVIQYSGQIKSVFSWMIKSMAGLGLGVLLFLLSIIISGVLLATSKAGGTISNNIARRIAGSKGEEFARITVITIRNVVKGILGVAIIQALLAGLGFLVAGIPGAGLWTLLCLIFAIAQIGLAPVTIPIIIYIFSTADLLTAILLTIWLIIVSTGDNVLKPILLGKGAPVPMLIVFLGAIGGFMTAGIIGLFFGAVVLSIGYKLFTTWLGEDKVTDEAA